MFTIEVMFITKGCQTCRIHVTYFDNSRFHFTMNLSSIKNYKLLKLHTTTLTSAGRSLAWTHSMGLPTSCLAASKRQLPTKRLEVTLQWSLNTMESVLILPRRRRSFTPSSISNMALTKVTSVNWHSGGTTVAGEY